MTKLSARQYAMLKSIARRHSVSLDSARELNQISFGSLIHREYVKFSRSEQQFTITDFGQAALEEFQEIEIRRQNFGGPFSHYFDVNSIRSNTNLIKMRKAS